MDNLLIKYMAHVYECEGSSFIYEQYKDRFTEEEWVELLKAEDEAIRQYAKWRE